MAAIASEMFGLNDNYFLNPAHAELYRARYALKDGTGKQLEIDISDTFRRVVNYLYQNDKGNAAVALQMRFDKKIIDAGRPLAQAGTETKNMFNCFVLGFEADTREAISELKRKHFHIQAQGGGTGTNFSTLRPRGSFVKKNQSRSSGAVGFITDVSYQSSNIQQGGQRCLPAESLVAMADGTWKTIDDVRAGDVVLAFDETLGKVVPSKVLRFYENGVQEVFEYICASGKSVKSTSNHKWLGVQTDGQLLVRTISAMPDSSRKIGFIKELPIFGTKTNKFSGIIGYLIGDGCFTGETIKLTNTKESVFEDFVSKLPSNANYWFNKERQDLYFSTDGEFQDYLRSLGLYHCKSYEKFIPDEFFEYSEKDINLIISGLFATDGSVFKDEVAYYSTSLELVEGIQRLLLKYGIHGYIQKDARVRKSPKNRRTSWTLRIKHPEFYNKFLATFNIVGKPGFMKDSDTCAGQLRKDCYFHKVKEVKSLGEQLTFCIEIEHPDHLFVVDGAVSHNSGANMGCLDDWHPDFYEFISKKSNHNWENIRKFAAITNEDEFAHFQWDNHYQWQMFNVSTMLSDDFMQRVISEDNRPWVLNWKGEPWHLYDFENVKGPKTGKPYTKKITVVAADEEMARYKASTAIPFFNNKSMTLLRGPYDMTAKEWWRMICKNAWEDGCPGVIFIDMARRFHNGEYFNPLSATNPCAEQFLPKNSVCCLTSLALPSFWSHAKNEFDWVAFEEAIKVAVRGLDNLTELNRTGEADIDANALRERRIGLGTTGLAELLIYAKLKYSSQDARRFTSTVLAFLRDKAYEASIELAKERGPFPAFEFEGYAKSEFFKNLPKEIQEKIRKYGIRNVTILTQAPVGTTGTMIGFGQGCEPYYFMALLRNSRVGTFMDGSPAFQKWLKDNNVDYAKYNYSLAELRKAVDVPSYFEEAHEVSWMDHLLMQAVFARYVDSSVSKTINLPATATVEDVENAYLTAYNLGIKSTTIYRDGSKQQILESVAKDEKQTRPEAIVVSHAPKRPENVECDIHHTSVKGEKWTVLVGLLNGKPYEVFCAPQEQFELGSKYKKGVIRKNGGGAYHLELGDLTLKNISKLLQTDEHRALTRMLSISLRHGVPVSFVCSQLEKSEGTVVDFSKAVCRVLGKYKDEFSSVSKRTCSSCGSSNIIAKAGCDECLDCNYQKCS